MYHVTIFLSVILVIFNIILCFYIFVRLLWFYCFDAISIKCDSTMKLHKLQEIKIMRTKVSTCNYNNLLCEYLKWITKCHGICEKKIIFQLNTIGWMHDK